MTTAEFVASFKRYARDRRLRAKNHKAEAGMLKLSPRVTAQKHPSVLQATIDESPMESELNEIERSGV